MVSCAIYTWSVPFWVLSFSLKMLFLITLSNETSPLIHASKSSLYVFHCHSGLVLISALGLSSFSKKVTNFLYNNCVITWFAFSFDDDLIFASNCPKIHAKLLHSVCWCSLTNCPWLNLIINHLNDHCDRFNKPSSKKGFCPSTWPRDSWSWIPLYPQKTHHHPRYSFAILLFLFSLSGMLMRNSFL